MKKFISISLTVILILVITLALTRNILTKTVLTGAIKTLTGLELNIGKVDIGILNTHAGIQGLVLHNPPDFQDEIMMDLPEIYIDYDLGALLKGKVHLEETRLNLKEFVVIKARDGKLNLDALKISGKEESEKPAQTKKAEEGKATDFQIDLLELKIGKVIYKDYSSGTEPKIKEYDVNINEQFHNVTDPKALMNTIVIKALMKTNIAKLIGFDLGSLTEGAADVLKGATSIATDTVEGVGKTAGKAIGTTTKKTADTLKKVLPFGK
ncbi:MAG: AsmA family protein [Chlamydiota bacterium]|nr:AsmA family protein [Chlamydiota bacterium]